MKKTPRTKFSDPLIVPRVKNYLSENVDKTFVDVSQMARSLKERYREYNNRNEGAFCQMVEAAYKIVLHSYGLDEGSSSDGSEEDSDDLELLDDGNVLNDQLMAMYKIQDKKGNQKKGGGNDKSNELIDISSDDESNGGKAPKLPKLNDQITISPHVPDSVPQKPKLIIPSVSINANNDATSLSKYEITSTPNNDVNRKRKTNHESASKTTGPKRKSTAHIEPEENKAELNLSKVTFEDIGGIVPILEQVCDLIMHMQHPEVYKQLGVKTPRGALLHGPPGTGKTLLANAIAGKLALPLISLPATELVGGMSGESEKRIRELFEKATSLAPCVLFIDEIDSICANRINAQKDMERRIVAQLLSSLDGLGEKDVSVLVLAATNNPDTLDPALRRAGRLEQEIALGIPTLKARRDILRIMCRGLNIDQNVDLNVIATLTPGFVGADLQALINKSSTVAIKRVFHTIRNEVPTGPVESNSICLNESNDPNVPLIIPESVGSANIEAQIEKANENTAQNGDIHTPKLTDNVDVETSEDVNVESESEQRTADISSEENKNDPIIQNSEPSNVNVEKVDSSPVESVLMINENIQKVYETTSSDLKDLQRFLDEVEPFTAEQLEKMSIMQEDILIALKSTRPCAIREGFATVPDTTWDDIGSLSDVRRELQLAVLAPVKYPEQLEALGLSVPSGVLLCGPPGCGKTLLAKAVANEAGINFISVKGPELLNMYVGESERAVRTCFQRARNSAPCVIFFDEFDSLCPRRTNGDSGGATRVVNQLLTEMDGIEGREGVFVLAATNRPDIIDPAVLRPGRLDRVLFVGMPLLQDRVDILKAITKKGTKPQLSTDVEVEVVAAATEGYTGADLAGLVRLAATQALTDFITGNIPPSALLVSATHFQKALLKMKPSVSAKEQQHYDKLRLKYSSLGEEKLDVDMDTEESMDTV